MILFQKDTFLGDTNPVAWPGMEELRTACVGIKIVEIESVSPDEKDLLTPREAARAEELGLRRRKAFTAARVALKGLARQIGLIDKDRPDSSIETLGPDRVRPCLPDSDLYCSVSHTGRFAVAVGNVFPVGVDIEVVAERIVRVWHLFMEPRNQDLISTSGIGPERTAARAWTMKEAAAKAFGLDLSGAIREVEVLTVGEKQSVIRYRENTYSVRHAEGESHVISLLTCDGF